MCVDDVYGGTQRYLRMILGPNTGIQVDFSDFTDIKKFKSMITAKTKLVWLETPTNPTLKIFDIAAIRKAIDQTGFKPLLVVDNTFTSPVNCNPTTLGADVTMNSMTKYIGGHSDLLGGCLCLNDRDLYDRIFFVLKSMCFHSRLSVNKKSKLMNWTFEGSKSIIRRSRITGRIR